MTGIDNEIKRQICELYDNDIIKPKQILKILQSRYQNQNNYPIT